MSMSINDSFRYMQSSRINELPKVDITKQQQANQTVEEPKQQQTPSISIEPVVDNRPKSVNPEEVSLTFNKNDEFGYIGRDKDVSLLDMQKAISMMRQDSALQDYQYFVGGPSNVNNISNMNNAGDVFSSADGSVIAK